MRSSLILSCFLALLVSSALAEPAFQDETWTDASRQREVPVRIRLPQGQGPFPVLLISHGLGGSRRGIAYLAEAAQTAGWLCISMQHAGSDELIWKGQRPGQIVRALKATLRTPKPALDRLKDVGFIMDELERRQKDGALAGKLRLDKIALAGHSFGAWTAFAAVGRQPESSTKFADRHANNVDLPKAERRVRAIIALSPQGEKTRALEAKAVAAITVPSLSITGSKDTVSVQSDMKPIQRRYSFDSLPETALPGYLLWFDDGDHMVFGGGNGDGDRRRWRERSKASYNDRVQKIVAKAAVDFLKREVLGDHSADLLRDPAKAKALMDGLGTVETRLPKK